MSAFIHARTFDTCWGQGLAFLDLDDETDAEVLKLHLWAPVCEDGSLGKVALKIGLGAGASDAAFDAMEEANRSALAGMDAARFEAAVRGAGIGGMLDRLSNSASSSEAAA